MAAPATPTMEVPSPLPGATRIVVTNAGSPYKGIRTSFSDPEIDTLLSNLPGVSTFSPGSPPGCLDLVRYATLDVTTGSSTEPRMCMVFTRPLVPTLSTSPGNEQYGDGTVVAGTGFGYSKPNNTRHCIGTEQLGDNALPFARWWPHLALTEHVGYWLADNLLVGDSAVFTLYIDRFILPAKYFEVYFGMITGEAVEGTGTLQYDEIGAISTPEWGEGVKSGPYPKRQWVPIAAECNVAAGPDTGDRFTDLFFEPTTSTPSLTDGTYLAHTGTRSKPKVENNNATGGYSNVGTGPYENVKGSEATHVQFSAGEFIADTDTVYLGSVGMPGDRATFIAVFLSMPAGAAFPPTS